MRLRNLTQYRTAERREHQLTIELGALLLASNIGNANIRRQAKVLAELNDLDEAMENYRHRTPTIAREHLAKFTKKFKIR